MNLCDSLKKWFLTYFQINVMNNEKNPQQHQNTVKHYRINCAIPFFFTFIIYGTDIPLKNRNQLCLTQYLSRYRCVALTFFLIHFWHIYWQSSWPKGYVNVCVQWKEAQRNSLHTFVHCPNRLLMHPKQTQTTAMTLRDATDEWRCVSGRSICVFQGSSTQKVRNENYNQTTPMRIIYSFKPKRMTNVATASAAKLFCR